MPGDVQQPKRSPVERRKPLRTELPSEFYGIRVGPIMAFPEVIRENGGDPEKLLAMANLPPDTFADSNNRLSVEAVNRLILIAALDANCPDAMLLAGMRFHFDLLGELGALMRHSPTVGAALRNMALHMHLHDRAAVPLLFTIGPDRVAFGYSLLDASIGSAAKIQETTQAILYCLLRDLCGPAWKPLAIQFAHARPADTRVLRESFPCPMHFDAEFSAVVFSAHWLEHRLPQANPALYKILQERMNLSELESERQLVEKVRGALRSMVLSGTASADAVASLLGISERTLRRRLEAEGTGFQALLNDTLLNLAKQLMSETRLSISEVSAALRYRDLASFSTAFRRWTGLSPSQWRQQTTAQQAAALTAGETDPGAA